MTVTTQAAPSSRSRSAVLLVILLFVVPGGIFLVKGGIELADRFAGRSTQEATLLSTAIGESYTNKGRTVERYEVRGITAQGERFGFDDRAVFALAEGRTPLPVAVDTSSLTGRVIAVRSDFGAVQGVGGATRLWLGALGLGLGLAFLIVPFALPWKTAARREAAESGAPPPRPDWVALAMVAAAAAVVVGGTLAWDLLR